MSQYSKETEVVMSGFTGGNLSPRRTTLGQRGESMVSLFIWMFLALAVMSGVISMFVSSSKTTATSAQHTTQQGAILNALNRVSRDVTDSDPIVYASATEMVVDVLGTNSPNSNTVERRRYLYIPASNKIVWQKKNVPVGTPYDAANVAAEWPTSINQTTIVNDMTPIPAGAPPLFQYFDKNSAQITALPVTGAAAEGIARVDLKATANVMKKGDVSLATSAVPRSRVIGDTPTANVPICPSFTGELNPDKTVTLRWAASDGATSYKVFRNGAALEPTVIVDDPSKIGYQIIDDLNTAATYTPVFNYMLQVTNSGGSVDCHDTVQTVILVTPIATNFKAELLPVTTFNAPNDPKSTAWSAAGELTRVKLSWKSVEAGSGYQLFRQQKDGAGNLVGSQRTLIYSTNDSSESSYTFTVPAADDGENWEWSIKVLAKTGDNDETGRITTLTYPTPVTQTAAKATTFGTNTVSWSGHNGGLGSLGYDIYRSPMDPAGTPAEGTYTKIGSTVASVYTFEDKNAALGSTYWYYVVSKNVSGFSNQFTAKKATQLQFPPDPVMSIAKVAGDGGSQDIADGQNRVNWGASKSAVGYHVWRVDFLNNTATKCFTGTTCAEFDGTNVSGNGNVVPGTVVGTSYVDNGADVTPASRYTYVAYAYNKTGLSPKLAANVAITQRPSAPLLNKTADPSLTSTVTKLSWNAFSAGKWCETNTDTTNDCSYVNYIYNNAGTEIANATTVPDGINATATYDWNQGWGKHYTYRMTAKNNAFFNGGVSQSSNTLSADTYPGDFSISSIAKDPWGNNSKRYVYETAATTTNTNERDHVLDSQGAQYFSIGWGNSDGAREYTWVRDGNANSAIGAAAVSMPTQKYLSGTVKKGDGNWAWAVAAPGSVYKSSVTATSEENNLTRRKASADVRTAADLPMQGFQQIVCTGPIDWPPNSIVTSEDGVNYAKRSWVHQSYSARLVNFTAKPRYGEYSGTYVTGKYQDANSVDSSKNYYWTDSWGNKYLVEHVKKGSISYYTTGFGHHIPAGGSYGNLDSNTQGQSTYRYTTGQGMKIWNYISGDPAWDSYWIFTIIDQGATRDDCGTNGAFKEPIDACYEWNGQNECNTVNQYSGTDGRPRWTTK